MFPLDDLYMSRCLALAQLGQGKTHPNPMVGCVVLDAAGKVVGEGYHTQYGAPHAEGMALAQAGDKAQSGTLYVNLEPCNHIGQTPPCTEAIVAAGIKTVVYGMSDPNPRVAGGGGQSLQSRGLVVRHGVLQAECQYLNEAFSHFVQTGRPFVILKQAMTLDGKIATRHGESQWITGHVARRWVHQLRAQCDGILTTAETVLKDNSQLTVREAPLLGKLPVRIVLDRHCRLDPTITALFQPVETGGPVWVFTKTSHVVHPNAQKAQAMGAKVFTVPDDGQGLDLQAVLEILGQERITQLLVEAGGRLAGSLIQQQLVQKLYLMYGPSLMLDPAAKAGFVHGPLLTLADMPTLQVIRHFQLAQDTVVEAYCNSL